MSTKSLIMLGAPLGSPASDQGTLAGRPSKVTEAGLFLERAIIAAAESLVQSEAELDALDAKVRIMVTCDV